MKLNDNLIGKLRSQGMEVIEKPDRASMKAKLGEFYGRWKGEFGATPWSLLEGYAGKLG
jgi:TRAP-type C4-dicarboxylate transport system substrate-binding protein